MRGGKLRNRVIIAKRKDKVSDYGHLSRELEHVADVWADIGDNKKASEQSNNDNIQYISTYSVYIRYNPTILDGYYMIVEGQTHRISNVYHDFRKRSYTRFEATYVEGYSYG